MPRGREHLLLRNRQLSEPGLAHDIGDLIVRPDGTLLAYQPYGEEGLLIADIDLSAATGFVAERYKPIE